MLGGGYCDDRGIHPDHRHRHVVSSAAGAWVSGVPATVTTGNASWLPATIEAQVAARTSASIRANRRSGSPSSPR